MPALDVEQQRQQLLRRLQSGQIDRAAFERQMAELDRNAARAAETPPPGGMNTPVAPQQQFVSKGDRATEHSSPAGLLHEGMMLSKYEVGKRLGRGGMGEVWKAFDTVGKRQVVIKILPSELQSNRVEIDRVLETFQRVHDLHHAHICPTIDLLQDRGIGYYLVIQYLDAVTLGAYRDRYMRKAGRFPLSEVARILKAVADALDYAHAQKVVHRDIKSENILVKVDGSDPQVIDFGLAAEIRTSVSRMSTSKSHGEMAGTYPYMAPEQWKGEPVDGKADQYALGVVAFELLSGRLPYLLSGGIEALRLCVLKDPCPRLGDQPETVNQAIARAMAKYPHERFATCRQFLDALSHGAPAAPPMPADPSRPKPAMPEAPRSGSSSAPAMPVMPVSFGGAASPSTTPAPFHSAPSTPSAPPKPKRPGMIVAIRSAIRSAWVSVVETRRSIERAFGFGKGHGWKLWVGGALTILAALALIGYLTSPSAPRITSPRNSSKPDFSH